MDKAGCKAAEKTEKEALEIIAVNRKKPLAAKYLRHVPVSGGPKRAILQTNVCLISQG